MRIKALLLSAFLFAGSSQVMSQTAADHLTVSSKSPRAGTIVSLTYDPAGTKLEKSTQVSAVVWLFDQKGAPYAIDLPLAKAGGTWTASLAIPDTISLAALKFSNGSIVDDSQPKGYLIDIYTAEGRPVRGNLLSRATVYYSVGRLMTVKADIPEATSSIEEEYRLYPESREKSKSLYNALVMAGKNPQMIAELKSEQRKVFDKSDASEEDLSIALNVLANGNKATGDSLRMVIKQRFPKGNTAALTAYQAFMAEKELSKRIVLFENSRTSFDKDRYEQSMLFELARSSAAAKNYDGFKKYSAMIKDKSTLPSMLNSVAWPLAEKGEDLDFAASLSKQSLELLDAAQSNPASPGVMYPLSERIKNNRSSYMMFADTYALILYKQDKLAEALAYQEKAVDVGGNPEVNERYTLFLEKNGKKAEAKAAIEKYIQAGKSTGAMKQQLQEMYLKDNGSVTGYDTYLASLHKAAKEVARKELVAKMISQPAPTFALKDFDGNTVTLASLKGKVVVVDFWATWCGPCKASFPGMQLAVNKFKADPSVAFLFIDTWETDPNYLQLAKKFIADNNYTFHGLYDQEIKVEKGKYKIVADYGVEGIPTKFIIDKTGNIRFKSVGFSGDTEGLADEIAAMIELAAKPAEGLATGK